jgi:hypothetical protein
VGNSTELTEVCKSPPSKTVCNRELAMETVYNSKPALEAKICSQSICTSKVSCGCGGGGGCGVGGGGGINSNMNSGKKC